MFSFFFLMPLGGFLRLLATWGLITDRLQLSRHHECGADSLYLKYQEFNGLPRKSAAKAEIKTLLTVRRFLHNVIVIKSGSNFQIHVSDLLFPVQSGANRKHTTLTHTKTTRRRVTSLPKLNSTKHHHAYTTSNEPKTNRHKSVKNNRIRVSVTKQSFYFMKTL